MGRSMPMHAAWPLVLAAVLHAALPAAASQAPSSAPSATAVPTSTYTPTEGCSWSYSGLTEVEKDWFMLYKHQKSTFKLRSDDDVLHEGWCGIGEEADGAALPVDPNNPSRCTAECTKCGAGSYLRLPDRETPSKPGVTKKMDDGEEAEGTPYFFREQIWQHRDSCRPCSHCFINGNSDEGVMPGVDPDDICEPTTGVCICESKKLHAKYTSSEDEWSIEYLTFMKDPENICARDVHPASSYPYAVICLIMIFVFGFLGVWSRLSYRATKFGEKEIFAPLTDKTRNTSLWVDKKAAELELEQAEEFQKREAVAQRIWALEFMITGVTVPSTHVSAVGRVIKFISYLFNLLKRVIGMFLVIIVKPLNPWINSIGVFLVSYFAVFFGLFTNALLTCQSFAYMPTLTGVTSSFISFQRIGLTTLNFLYSLKLNYVGFYQIFGLGVGIFDGLAMTMDISVETDITCTGSYAPFNLMLVFLLLFIVMFIYDSRLLIFLKMVIAEGIGPALTRAIGAMQAEISIYKPKSLRNFLGCNKKCNGFLGTDAERKKNSVCRVSRPITRGGAPNYMTQFGITFKTIPDEDFDITDGVVSIPLKGGGTERKLDKFHDVIDQVYFQLMDDETHAKVAKTKMGVEIIGVGSVAGDNKGVKPEWEPVILPSEQQDEPILADNFQLDGEAGWRIRAFHIGKYKDGEKPMPPILPKWQRLQFGSQLYSAIRDFFDENPAPVVEKRQDDWFLKPGDEPPPEDVIAELFIELERDPPDFGAVLGAPKAIPMLVWGALGGIVAAVRYVIKVSMTTWFIFMPQIYPARGYEHNAEGCGGFDGFLAGLTNVLLCLSLPAIVHVLLRTFAPGLPRGYGRMFARDRAVLFEVLESLKGCAGFVCRNGKVDSAEPKRGEIVHIESHEQEPRTKLARKIGELSGLEPENIVMKTLVDKKIKSLKKQLKSLDDAPVFYDVRFTPTVTPSVIEPAVPLDEFDDTAPSDDDVGSQLDEAAAAEEGVTLEEEVTTEEEATIADKEAASQKKAYFSNSWSAIESAKAKAKAKAKDLRQRALGDFSVTDKNVRFDNFHLPKKKVESFYITGYELRQAARFSEARVAKLVDTKLDKKGYTMEEEYDMHGHVLPPGNPYPGICLRNSTARVTKVSIAPLQADYAKLQAKAGATTTTTEGGAPSDFISDEDLDRIHLSGAVLICSAGADAGAPSSGVSDDDIETFVYEVPAGTGPGDLVIDTDPHGIPIKFYIPEGGDPGAKLQVDFAPLDDDDDDDVDVDQEEDDVGLEADEMFEYIVPEGKAPGDEVTATDTNGSEVKFYIPEGGFPGAKLGIPCAPIGAGAKKPKGLAHMVINQYYPKPIMGASEWAKFIEGDERQTAHSPMGLLPPVLDEAETKYRVGDTVVWRGIVADVLEVTPMWPEKSPMGKAVRISLKVLSKVCWLLFFVFLAMYHIIAGLGALCKASKKKKRKKEGEEESAEEEEEEEAEKPQKSPLPDLFTIEEWQALPLWKRAALRMNSLDPHLERLLPNKHAEWGMLVRFRPKTDAHTSSMYDKAYYETPGTSLRFPLKAKRNMRYLNFKGLARAKTDIRCCYFCMDEVIISSQEESPTEFEVNSPGQLYSRVMEQVKMKPGYAFKIDIELAGALEKGMPVDVLYTNKKYAPKSTQETRVMYSVVDGDVTVIDRRAELPSFLEVFMILVLGFFNRRFGAVFNLNPQRLVAVWLFKLQWLLQLTFGLWTEKLIDNYRIAAISEAYHVHHLGDDETPEKAIEKEKAKNMNVLNLVGETYTMIYYFFPHLVALAQLGAASNASPLYIASTSYQDETLLLRQKKKKAMKFLGIFKDDPEFVEMLGSMKSKEAAYEKHVISDPDGAVAGKWRSKSVRPVSLEAVALSEIPTEEDDLLDVETEPEAMADQGGEKKKGFMATFCAAICTFAVACGSACLTLFSKESAKKAFRRATVVGGAFAEGRIWPWFLAMSNFSTIIAISINPGATAVLTFFAASQLPSVLVKVYGTLQDADILGEKYVTVLLEAYENIIWLFGGLENTATEYVFVYLENVKKMTDKAKKSAEEQGIPFDETAVAADLVSSTKAVIREKNLAIFSEMSFFGKAAPDGQETEAIVTNERLKAAVNSSDYIGTPRVKVLGTLCGRFTYSMFLVKLAKAESLRKQQASAMKAVEEAEGEEDTSAALRETVASVFDDNLHCNVFGVDFGVAPHMLLTDIFDEVRQGQQEASVRQLCLALGNVGDGAVPSDVLMRLMVMLYAAGHPNFDPDIPPLNNKYGYISKEKYTEVIKNFLGEMAGGSENPEVAALNSTSLDGDDKVKMWSELFDKISRHSEAKMTDLKDSTRELLEVSNIYYDAEAFLAHLEDEIKSDKVTKEQFLDAVSKYSNNLFWGMWWRGPGHGWWQ